MHPDAPEVTLENPAPSDIEVVNEPHVSVGDTVLYVAYGTPNGEYTPGAYRAAIVTEVIDQQTVNLFVVSPHGVHFPQKVKHGDQPGGWIYKELIVN